MSDDAEDLALEAIEAFGISFPNAEMAKIVTAGQFYEAVIRGLPLTDRRRCHSASTFYRLRQTLLEVTGRERREVRPSTRVEVLIPRRRRKAVWKEMQKRSSLRFPRLRLPNWGIPGALVPLVLFAVTVAFTVEWPWSYLFIPLGVPVLLLSFWAVDAILGTDLPNHAQTVGGLTRTVLAKNFAKLATEQTGYDRNEVWEAVRILIADQLDVELEKVTREASLVADLGMK